MENEWEWVESAPTQAEREVLAAYAQGDRLRVNAAMLEVARDVLARMESFGRIDVPPPPRSVFGVPAATPWLAAYRYEVERIEERNAGRIKVLLCHGRRLADAGDHAAAERFRRFVCKSWRVYISALPEIRNCEKVAKALGRRYDRLGRDQRG